MPRKALFVLIALLGPAACGGSSTESPAPRPPPVQQRTIDVNGVARSYRLFIPSTLELSRAWPLVIVLHGGGNTGESMVESTQFDREASVGEFIVAYPDGIDRSWNAKFCCGRAFINGVDDVGFLTRLIDDAGTSAPIDKAQVYATGVSNGAMMAYTLGCERPDLFAGIGSVAGSMYLGDCAPSRAVSVIEIHGTADTLVPMEGGGQAPGVTAERPIAPVLATVERWAAIDRCAQGPARRTDTQSRPRHGLRARTARR